MDRSEDWCYFDALKNACLDNEVETNEESYSHWLITISEIRNRLFIAKKNILQMHPLIDIEDYFSAGPASEIALDNEITFILSDDLGKNLALAQSTKLSLFLINDLLRGIKTFESFNFDSPVRLMQFRSDTLGVLLLSNELILISNNQITKKQSEISYFSFLSSNSLIQANDSKLSLVSLPSFSPTHEVDSTPKTFGLASNDSKIFQFLVENESTLNLNIYSDDLQLLTSIDLLDSFPFAAHSSLERLLELPVISKFWFCDQRNLVLMTASCLTSVEVIMMDEDMERVNFEENTSGQFKLLWKNNFENTARGFEVIRVSDKSDEMFEYQLKDTSYNISQPPLIAARDSGGNFIVKRFIDLRKDYLQDKICIKPEEVKINHQENIEEVKAQGFHNLNPRSENLKPQENAKDPIKPDLAKSSNDPANPKPNPALPGPFETPKGKPSEPASQTPLNNPAAKASGIFAKAQEDPSSLNRGQPGLAQNPFSSKPLISDPSGSGPAAPSVFSSSANSNPFANKSLQSDPKPQAPIPSNPGSSFLASSNPLKSGLSGLSGLSGSSDASLNKPGNFFNSSMQEKPASSLNLAASSTENNPSALSKPNLRSSLISQGPSEPVTVSGSIIGKMDEVMQLLMSNLQKSCKTIESLNVDYSKSAAFKQSIDRKFENIVNTTIRLTGKVRDLQVKTAELEDKTDFVKNSSDNYTIFDNEDIDERLFDDYTKLAESTTVYSKYFDIAVKPICSHHACMRNKLDTNVSRNTIDSIKKTKTFQPKNAKVSVDLSLVNNVINETKAKLDKTMKDLQAKVRNSKRIFEKNPVTVYNFCLNSDDEEY